MVANLEARSLFASVSMCKQKASACVTNCNDDNEKRLIENRADPGLCMPNDSRSSKKNQEKKGVNVA